MPRGASHVAQTHDEIFPQDSTEHLLFEQERQSPEPLPLLCLRVSVEDRAIPPR